MQASELIDAPVYGPDRGIVGTVLDVRVRVEQPGGALIVHGLIVARTRMRLFGYQRREEVGPALLDRVQSFVHRHTKFASTSQVDITASGRVRLTVDWNELPRIRGF